MNYADKAFGCRSCGSWAYQYQGNWVCSSCGASRPVPAKSAPSRVTYFNPATEQRHVLIDDIDESTADAVVQKCGDRGDEFYRLPQVRKERATGSAS